MDYATFLVTNRRMLFGIALSFFLHAMVFSLAGGSVLPKDGLPARHELEVYLQPAPVAKKSPPEQILLSGATSTYRVSGKSSRVPTLEVDPETKNSGERIEAAPQGLFRGLSLPRAIGLPWLPPDVPVRPVQRHEWSAEAYRAMHEAEQMALRKQSMQAQMIAALTAVLEAETYEASGRCRVSQSSESRSLNLECDSVSLEKMLREKHADALTSLFGVAGVFDIAFSQNKARITLESK